MAPATSTGDNIFHLAFTKSAQANIIIVVSSGQIIGANAAAWKLFGYTKKELLALNRSFIFDITETTFRQMMETRGADGQAVATVHAIRKSGRRIVCEITSAVFTGDDGIEKSITSVANLSKGISAQKVITEQNAKNTADVNSEWIKHIGKTSYDVMWDWDITTGIAYVGDSIEELFGHKIQNNSIPFARLTGSGTGRQKNDVEKKIYKTLASKATAWSAAYPLQRSDGTVANVTSRAAIIRDASGKALRMIGATQDVSRVKELEQQLENEVTSKRNLISKYKKSFKLIFNSTSDLLFDIDLAENTIIFSDAYEKLFGYRNIANMSPVAGWADHIHPEDKDAVIRDYTSMLSATDTEWKCSYRFIKSDGLAADVTSSAVILRDRDGVAYRMIGSIQDSGKAVLDEEKPAQDTLQKQRLIDDTRHEAEEAVRSEIGKELHDNINQLLGASKLYLNMAKKGGGNSDLYLSKSSEYTSIAIEEIRKLSKGLTTETIQSAGLIAAIMNLTRDIMEVHPVKITCMLSPLIEEFVSDSFKLNIFRIIQEQLNNILKHAQASKVKITLMQFKNAVNLSITDNGVGFDIRQKQSGIGLENIYGRAAAFNGKAYLTSTPGQGCELSVHYTITSKIPETA